MPPRFGRRDLLRAALATGAVVSLPIDVAGCGVGRQATKPSETLSKLLSEGIFLVDAPGRPRRATCAALCSRIVPTGSDLASDPGATEADAVTFIDLFLSAFELPGAVADDPAIYVHGRYSGDNPYPDNANGTPSRRFPRDDFVSLDGRHNFLALSRHQELSWRMQLYGRETLSASGGSGVSTAWLDQVGSLIPAPAMLPLRTIYSDGLDAFDAAARQRFGRPLADATSSQQDDLLAQAAHASSVSSVSSGSSSGSAGKTGKKTTPPLPESASTLFPQIVVHTFEACYSLPAYGGNRDAAMWKLIGWDGDTQPLGNSIYDESLAGPGAGPNAGFGQGGIYEPRGGYREYRAVSGPGPGTGPA